MITANAMGAYTFGLLKYGPGLHAGALAFHSLTLSQLLHAYSCRSRTRLGSTPKKSNPWLHTAVLGSIGLHVLTILIPGLRTFLNLTPLRLADLGIILGSTVSSFGLNEMLKSNRSVSGKMDLRLVKNPTTGDYEYQSRAGQQITAQDQTIFFNHSALENGSPMSE